MDLSCEKLAKTVIQMGKFGIRKYFIKCMILVMVVFTIFLASQILTGDFDSERGRTKTPAGESLSNLNPDAQNELQPRKKYERESLSLFNSIAKTTDASIAQQIEVPGRKMEYIDNIKKTGTNQVDTRTNGLANAEYVENNEISVDKKYERRKKTKRKSPKNTVASKLPNGRQDLIDEQAFNQIVLNGNRKPHAFRNFVAKRPLNNSAHGSDARSSSTFKCIDPELLDTNSDYLLTAEEVPLVPDLKNPCFCSQGHAKIKEGIGVVR